VPSVPVGGNGRYLLFLFLVRFVTGIAVAPTFPPMIPVSSGDCYSLRLSVGGVRFGSYILPPLFCVSLTYPLFHSTFTPMYMELLGGPLELDSFRSPASVKMPPSSLGLRKGPPPRPVQQKPCCRLLKETLTFSRCPSFISYCFPPDPAQSVEIDVHQAVFRDG